MKTCLAFLFAVGVAHAADTDWSPLGSGFTGNGSVDALAVSGASLYAGYGQGQARVFTNASGGAFTNCIAKWDGTGWSALGLGVDGGDVYALAASGGTLYVGGDFNTAGGNPDYGIAQWNGSAWSPIGTWTGGWVGSVTVSDGTLYAGGGGSYWMSEWTGNSWSNYPPMSANGSLNALAVRGNTVFVGGYFDYVDNAGPYFALWNGNQWTSAGYPVGNPMGPVTALAVSGSILYAGDNGGDVAQWDGSTWLQMGQQLDGRVDAFAIWNNTLYAATVHAYPRSATGNVYQWNGNAWSATSSGMNGGVNALAVSDNTLYAGGGFTGIGANTNVFNGIAQINLSAPPVSLAIINTNATFGFTNGLFGFDVSGPSGSNVVIQVSTDLQTWMPLQTNLLDSGVFHFSDSQSPTNQQRFYRAHL